jgi:ADP-heptose:LPS heptosyltransferase
VGTVAVRGGSKRALVVRYGAIGDIVQSTPVFKKLKEEGYHVTLNCTGPAQEILKHNPNVDEFIVQIKDYVPNDGKKLEEYWSEVGKSYDKFINLTGAAEDSLLVADKFIYRWSTDIRKAHPELDEASVLHNALNVAREKAGTTNYYDNHLAKAGYSDTGMNGEIFFSEQEEIMAAGFRKRHEGKFIILWSLAGSSYHKIYPYFHLVLSEDHR